MADIVQKWEFNLVGKYACMDPAHSPPPPQIPHCLGGLANPAAPVAITTPYAMPSYVHAPTCASECPW
jgi:hypothetical protein